ncbi:MAG: universal stress protein [Candidatus Thermoplasmatota archaeon]|nr:universal stress protein [Candidatus Thermoplasmatota archaeon]
MKQVGIEMTESRKKILVPTSGYFAAKERGDYIIEVAKRFNAEVLVVHVRDPKFLVATNKESEGWAALKYFEERGKEAGVPVQSFFTSGELVEVLKRFAVEHKADLVLVGASANRLIAEWVTFDLMSDLDTPILVIPQDMSDLI